MKGAGRNVISVPVHHRHRLHGQSHYDTLLRLFAGIIDMGGVKWLNYRTSSPEIERMDHACDKRADMDCLRSDRPAAVFRSLRNSVTQQRN